MQSDHNRITAAGWTHRMNERGWTIYRDPETGLWRTRGEAVAVVEHHTLIRSTVAGADPSLA